MPPRIVAQAGPRIDLVGLECLTLARDSAFVVGRSHLCIQMVDVLFHEVVELPIVADDHHSDRWHVLFVFDLLLEEVLNDRTWSLTIWVLALTAKHHLCALLLFGLELQGLPNRPVGVSMGLLTTLIINLIAISYHLKVYFPLKFLFFV